MPEGTDLEERVNNPDTARSNPKANPASSKAENLEKMVKDDVPQGKSPAGNIGAPDLSGNSPAGEGAPEERGLKGKIYDKYFRKYCPDWWYFLDNVNGVQNAITYPLIAYAMGASPELTLALIPISFLQGKYIFRLWRKFLENFGYPYLLEPTNDLIESGYKGFRDLSIAVKDTVYDAGKKFAQYMEDVKESMKTNAPGREPAPATTPSR